MRTADFRKLIILFLIIFVVWVVVVTAISIAQLVTDCTVFPYHITWLVQNSPSHFWSLFGISLSAGLSIIGAGIGIYSTGVSICGAGVHAPRIKTKNLISIIFCEASAIYGVIIAVILAGFQHDYKDKINDELDEQEFALIGYITLGSGLSVGCTNLFCAIAVGVLGSTIAIADAANSSLFIRMLLIEIFASAIGLYGLIVGVYLTSAINEVIDPEKN